jgi:hypothetical protein
MFLGTVAVMLVFERGTGWSKKSYKKLDSWNKVSSKPIQLPNSFLHIHRIPYHHFLRLYQSPPNLPRKLHPKY